MRSGIEALLNLDIPGKSMAIYCAFPSARIATKHGARNIRQNLQRVQGSA
jgi:hypothetical protein